MGWTAYNGNAVYNGAIPSQSLYQTGLMNIGESYSLSIEITCNTGKVVVFGFENVYEYSASGIYTINDTANSTTLTFKPDYLNTNMFSGSVDIVSLFAVTNIQLVDIDFNYVSDLDYTVSRSGSFITQCIDFTGQAEGTYYLSYVSDGFTYYSDAIRLITDTTCTLELRYSCNDNAFGFEFENTGTEFSMRLDGKIWQPSYINERNEYFRDSRGIEKAIYVNSIKKFLLSIAQQPEYMHDALRVALKCDNFYVNNNLYTYSDSEYSPKWRKSSDLAPVEVEIKENKSLINANCI